MTARPTPRPSLRNKQLAFFLFFFSKFSLIVHTHRACAPYTPLSFSPSFLCFRAFPQTSPINGQWFLDCREINPDQSGMRQSGHVAAIGWDDASTSSEATGGVDTGPNTGTGTSASDTTRPLSLRGGATFQGVV